MDAFDSTDRGAVDFILFGLAFFGFILATTGVVIDSLATTSTGGLILLLSILFFALRSSPGD
jgi:hypothetical protein